VIYNVIYRAAAVRSRGFVGRSRSAWPGPPWSVG